MTADVTVLLPVHAGVGAEELRRCLGSIDHQTLPPSEIVIVEDGPLTEEQLSVLDSSVPSGPRVKRIRLAENSGAGVANQTGLVAATCTWIAKADADDISCPERFERQMAELQARTHDVLGAAMAEFSADESRPTGVRGAPISHEAIARRMRWNSPINHPTSMYRRDLALEVGGYSDLRYMQDYDLFARMLASGARMHNMPDVLVLFRASPALFRRRSSREAIRCEFELQRNLRRYGLFGPVRQHVNLGLRLTFRFLPPAILRRAYLILFVRRSRAPNLPQARS